MLDTESLGHLSKLLTVLKASSVSSFKYEGLELTFHVEQNSAPRLATQDHTIDVPIDEALIPPDLRTDNITDMDKVLHWSSGNSGDAEIPLTGEAQA